MRREKSIALPALAAAIVLILQPACLAAAAGSVPAGSSRVLKATMVIHGTTVAIEPYAVLEGGRLVVPIRPVCEMLGANVDWNHAERSILVTRAGHVIHYVLGRSQATVSRMGEGFSTTEVMDLPSAPYIREGYTFAPLDSITKGLAINARVDTEAFSRPYWLKAPFGTHLAKRPPRT